MNINPCDSNANCMDTDGSFECICNSGYSDSGGNCEGMYNHSHRICYYILHLDIDECISSPCGNNSLCTNTNGSYECTCNPGFTGDGLNCEGKAD